MAQQESPGPDAQRFQYTEIHMGVPVRITVSYSNQALVERAVKAGYKAIADLEQITSDYRPTSELMQLCAKPHGHPYAVSPRLYTILRKALDVAAVSKGAFDPTVGPYVQLWRETRKSGKLPSPKDLSSARDSVGFQHVILGDNDSTVTLKRPRMRLDLGGIAKGSGIDAISQGIRQFGIRSYLIEAGGDMFANGVKSNGEAWKVQLGRQVVDLMGALSISGDASQYITIGKRRYSHIIDPRTGLGMESPRHVAVRCSRSEDADCIATAACVLGPKAAGVLNGLYQRCQIEFLDRSDIP
jgi:thiamine biosynthesis lipoprotein